MFNAKFYDKIKIMIVLIFGFVIQLFPEEGMFPLSEIRKLDLKKAGFKIDVDDLYNPNGTSLITALVNLSGCTGSFISENGLMLTNHHCSYRAISSASSVEKNYLENGFSAASITEEIEAKGITAKIIESYKDVSDIILESIKGITDDTERKKEINKKIKEIAESESDKENDIDASVAEMLPGKSYILFRYKTINDVRIVYAPPQSIGNFGGEEDNWIWPRHTGDFTFLRAYVAPDGSSRKYNVDNVPYQPKKWLKINSNGINENDFAFILGYPGRTYRHQPAQFLSYQFNYLLPNVSQLHDWLINLHEELSQDNDSLKLEYAPIIKSLANTTKNFKGKILGIKRLDLINKKINEEKEIIEFINKSNLSESYGNIFEEFEKIYKRKNSYAQAEILVDRLTSYSNIYKSIEFILNYQTELAKPDDQRLISFQEKNLSRSLNNFYKNIGSMNLVIEKRIFTKLICEAKKLNTDNKILTIDLISANLNNEKDVLDYVSSHLLSNSKFFDNPDTLINMTEEVLVATGDKLINLCNGLRIFKQYVKTENEAFDGAVSRLLPQLVDVKMLKSKTEFIPDANSTLRLTFGHIKGYSPADATYYKPFTTLSGVIDKSNRGDVYKIPEKLYELNKIKKDDKFFSKDLNDIPVGFLYNMDTTGGNSGSPVLNAYGELIGLNFDRAFEATINDFAWSDSYSRSIGVDIRYILYLAKNLGNSPHLLKELNID